MPWRCQLTKKNAGQNNFHKGALWIVFVIERLTGV
jgi:hypothetical protein